MKKRSDTVIHIGVPKSGTTSLQFHFFNRHSEINFLGKPYWNESIGLDKSVQIHHLIDRIWQRDSLAYDQAKEKKLASILLEERIVDNKITLISEEGLTNAGFVDRGVILERLKNTIGAQKIILSIRNQLTAIPSLYWWYYTRGIVNGSFGNWLGELIEQDYYRGGKQDFPLRQYDYFNIVSYCVNIFGKENVLVLPQEKLAISRQDFCSELSQFMSISNTKTEKLIASLPKSNSNRGVFVANYQRMLHKSRKFYYQLSKNILNLDDFDLMGHHLFNDGINKHINNILATSRSSIPLNPNHREYLTEYYKNSNNLLSELLEVDLGELGYPI